MKKLKLVSLLLFLSVTVYSQNKKLDSLWSVYNNTSLPDSNRVKAIHAIAWGLRLSNPDTAIILAQQELNLANTLPNKMGKKWMAKSFNVMGASYLNKATYPKSLEFYLKAQKLFEELNEKLGVANCYANILTVYLRQKMFAQALDCGFKALKIYEEVNDKRAIGLAYQNIGVCYEYQLNYAKALEYCLKAIPILEETGNTSSASGCNNTIAVMYKEMANYPKAIEYDAKALQICRENKDDWNAIFCYGNLGDLYDRWGKYKLAIQYSDSELILAKELQDIEAEKEAYEIRANVYAKTGQYKEAYEAHVKNKLLNDSIYNEENSRQLGDLKTNFEVERKEAELKAKAELDKTVIEAQHKRKQLIAAFIIMLVILIAVFLINRQKLNAKKNKIIFEQQEALLQSEKQKVEEELLNAKKLLTNYTENLIEKNSAIEGFKTEIEKLKGLKSTEIYNEKIEVLDDLSSSTILTNEDWDKFKNLFDQVYKGFFVRLKDKFATLTNAETRLMSLIKLNLDTKQMANMLGVSPETITKTRYRLKKKLNLNEGDSLEKVVESV